MQCSAARRRHGEPARPLLLRAGAHASRGSSSTAFGFALEPPRSHPRASSLACPSTTSIPANYSSLPFAFSVLPHFRTPPLPRLSSDEPTPPSTRLHRPASPTPTPPFAPPRPSVASQPLRIAQTPREPPRRRAPSSNGLRLPWTDLLQPSFRDPRASRGSPRPLLRFPQPTPRRR